MTRERLALNTSLWIATTTLEQKVVFNRQTAAQDFASYLLEHDTASLAERINYVELEIDKDGDLFHPAFGKMKAGMVVETENDQLELNAVDRIIEWASESTEGVCVWISPPYQEQNESRLIIYELEQENGGQKKVKMHATCTLQDTQACLFMARQLSAFCPEDIEVIENEEQLRETPIPFTVKPHYPHWTHLLEELVDPPEIWEAIRNGDHIKRKENALQVGETVVAEYFDQITTAVLPYEHVSVGAQMEARARELGYQVQSVGSCGISNTQALSSYSRNSPFTFLHSTISQGERKILKCTCPSCGRKVDAEIYGGKIHCPECNSSATYNC
jgi:hypothetical protein